jgi:hypothetical protein
MGRFLITSFKKSTVITNFWSEKILPFSWNLKNKTVSWSGLDNLNNCDPFWNIPISYQYNNQGFRTHDLTSQIDKEVNIALGCSHTEGIGLPIEMTWPAEIEQQTKITTLNLGLGQGSTDTVARILTNVSGLFSIKNVYILWPAFNRFEIYSHDFIESIIPSSAALEHVWYLNEFNSNQRFFKNQLLVHNLQKQYNFNLKEILPDSGWAVPGDLARDQMHNGPKSNQNLANLFLT